MSISGISPLYNNDIKPKYKDCFSKVKSIRSFQSRVVEVLKTNKEVCRTLIIHYPKTVLITAIANLILGGIFSTTMLIVSSAITSAIVFNHFDYIVTAIKEYANKNISEWFSSYEDKKALELIIRGKVIGNNFLDSISHFFRIRT